MANLTLEQQRALALANARLRLQQQSKVAPKKKPEETGFLEDIKDVGIAAGKSALGIAEGLLYPAERIGLAFPGVKEAAAVIKQKLEGARSEADIALEKARQQKITEAATDPGAVARGISNVRSFIEGPERPAQSRTVLSDIADAMSPARAVAKLLPKTPEEAQREVTSVTSQFASPKEIAEFIASQAPATAATIFTGGGARAAALAGGLERAAANKIAERVAVGTGITLNASDAGYGAAQDVLAKGGTQAEADRAYAIAAAGAAATSKLAAKIPGLEQQKFSSAAPAPGIIRGAIRSAAGEAPQEFAEEAGSQLSQNIAKLGTAAETPISEGVLSSGVLGAIGGAGIAAPTGALEGFSARGQAQAAPPPPPPPPPGAEPLRTTTVSYPNRDDPTAPTTRTMDVMSEPDDEGYVTVRDDTGKVFEMKAADLDEMEAASPAYAPPAEPVVAPTPAPTVDPATNLERISVASGTAEGKKPAPRVISLANDVTEALAADDVVAAQDIIQKRTQALAKSRMAEATKAQRQAELDEAQSIVNDYRVEYGQARAAGPAIVETGTTPSSAVEQAREQNEALAKEEAQSEALRAAEERLRLQRESEFETASNIGQGSPASQAQTARQQLFQSIIEDDTIPNPAGAFRQALRDRGLQNTELNEAERRQLQARRGFTKPANIVPFTGETVEAEVIEPTPKVVEPIDAEFTEVPTPLPPAPPEVVAGAAAPAPSRRAQLLSGTATIEPGVPGVAFGEPAPAADPYADVSTAVQDAFDNGEITEQAHRLLTGAIADKRATPEKIADELDKAQARSAGEAVAGGEKARDAASGSIIGGTEVDIDAFRGRTLNELLDEISSNKDGKHSAEDAFLAERLNYLVGQLQEAGADVTLNILQAGDQSPISIARGSARGLAETDLKTRKIDVYLRSPKLGRAGNTTEIILHEALHAVSTAVLLAVRNGRGTPEMVQFAKDLNDLRNKVIQHFNQRVKTLGKEGLTEFELSMYENRNNAFKNVAEFLTWGTTNDKAKEYLRSIKVGPGKNLLSKFIDAFRSLLGISPNDESALARLADIVSPLFETTAEGYKTTFVENGAASQGQEAASDKMYAGRSITEPRAGESEEAAKEREAIAADYAVAQQMERAGESPETIRVATGWERNPYDNEWRYLQPDDRASETRLLDDFISDFNYAEGAYATTFNSDGSLDLGDVLNHSDLYKIYPQARKIKFRIKDSTPDSGLQGSYDPETETITFYTGAVDPLGTILHEVQHWVQHKEGFAFGANTSTIWDSLTADQVKDEAENSLSVLRREQIEAIEVAQLLDYLRADKGFKAALRNGTALDQDVLDDAFGRAFDSGLIVEDEAYDNAKSELQLVLEKRAELGLTERPLNATDLNDSIDALTKDIADKNELMERIEGGDVLDNQSDAHDAAREAFENVTRRNSLRYNDTAGEIEARDVTKSRGLSRAELRQRGALGTEKLRTPKQVVITSAENAPPASSVAGPNATVTPATTQGAKLGFLANIRGFMSDMYRKHLYKYSGALKLDQKLANALGVKTLPKQMSLEDRASMYETMRSGMLRDFNRMWFNPFKAMLKASGIDPQDLSMYLWARAATARNALVAERNRDMPDGGSGMSNLDAEAVMSFYKASGLMRKLEPLVAFHDKLVDWMLKQRVKAGLMSQEEADLLRKNQPFYTPLKGFAADGDMFAAGDEDPHAGYDSKVQLGVRPKDYIKTTGRASMPFDPMSNLISDAMQLTQRIAKNEVGKRFLSIIRDFPDLLGSAVKVYTDKKPKIVNKGIAAPGSKKKTVGPLNMAANAKDFLVVKDGGQNFYIEFDEKTSDGEQMKRMFDNMTPKELEGALKFLTKLGGFKKQLLTRFSAVFWPINFIRDVQDAVITAYSEQTRIGSPVEGKKVALRTLTNLGRPSTWKAVGQYMSGRDPVKAEEVENVLLLSQMVQDGGEVGRQFVLDAETIATDIKKDLAVIKNGGAENIWGAANNKRRALVRVVDHINEFLSLVPRFAAYKAAIDEGVTPDDAAKFALDSTLNLARKGEASQVVDNIWLFSNPAAQSLEKKKRIYSSKNGRRAMAGMMALGVGLHFFNMMMAGDDDDDGENDYQEMDELTKMSNLVIYTGDGPPIKLPVGFLVGFETYLGQQMARMVTNDGSGIGILEAAGNAASAFFATQIPAGEKVSNITDVPKLAVPDVLTPAVDLWRNKNAFDGQIYPEPYYEGQAVSGMARRSTGEFYKKFAQGLNSAGGGTEDVASGMDTPAEAWQYLINQSLLTGGAALPRDMAKYFEEGAPADLTKVPVVKRFVGDNREFSAQNKYYDRVKKVEVIAGQYEGDNADPDAYAESEEKFPVDSDTSVIEAFKEANKALRELSKEKRAAQRDGGDGLDETLKSIEDRQREEYVKFNTIYNDVKRGQ